ncbi:MAG: CAAD domain-containing protein [Synechococcales cyanobacterium M58_A2018_015]|nr:CAAD domain-containing protein [Synechococcales cyanobacterium M58_A2018_015]
MEPEVKQETTSSEFGAEKVTVKIEPEDPGVLETLTDEANAQWRQIGDKVSAFLADLPEYLGDFFGEYKRPIVTIGLILGAIIAVKLLLAILGAINDIPLLSSFFELVGMGYSAWFVYRYLLKASTRKELGEDFNALKEQILGNKLS